VKGYYIPPTVVTGATHESPLVIDEIFGPLVCVLPFDTDEQAVQLANSSQYGLSASLWSTNVQRVHNTAHQLQVDIYYRFLTVHSRVCRLAQCGVIVGWCVS
jgi:aminomuconate-semialdehyde/2-hydroxymuconate-6-semialdehyde dehydrogenase